MQIDTLKRNVMVPHKQIPVPADAWLRYHLDRFHAEALSRMLELGLEKIGQFTMQIEVRSLA